MDNHKSGQTIFMMKKSLHFFIFLFLISCSHKKYINPNVQIQTQFGDIQVELYPDKAPKSVAAFLLYVDSGLYKNSSFYRVLKEENQPSSSFKSELIQGGIWQSNSKKAITLAGYLMKPHNSQAFYILMELFPWHAQHRAVHLQNFLFAWEISLLMIMGTMPILTGWVMQPLGKLLRE